jgi:hypothetical protein
MILEPPVEVVMSEHGFLSPINMKEAYTYPGSGALPRYDGSSAACTVEPGAGNMLLIAVRENLFKNLGGLTEFGLILQWGNSPRLDGASPVDGVYENAQISFGSGGPQYLGELTKASPGPLAGTVYQNWEGPIIAFPTASLGVNGLYNQGETAEYLTRIVAPRDTCKIFLYTNPLPYTPAVPGSTEVIIKVGFGHNCQGACQPERQG